MSPAEFSAQVIDLRLVCLAMGALAFMVVFSWRG